MKTQDSLMLYKLMVLYMLKVTRSPLTGADISDYILMKNYTDSLKLQSVISELTDSKMIIADKKHNRTYLTLTIEGLETINSLESRISSSIRNDIYQYLTANASELKSKHSIIVSCKQIDFETYVAECSASDRDGEILNLRLSFPTENLAKSACDNFEKNSNDIYEYIIKTLLTP